ncbi:hypothetical protein BCR34DRAFT_146416 [Clohesyomyces aquaticus]|uniref:Cora-like Mg2+ transporter protein-domain-containing protein n=1 Tax=Clohesyomyces aquaticus TaxID=1231657 RepID=A0A1Y1YKW4_9PLEO|nr:hypothetical protein BCR34DRAFT_146416 [Clohesyomyces aquaticus]
MSSQSRPVLDKSPSNSKSRTNTRKERPLTDREYADRVKSYARLSTGQHYHSLANFLFAPYQRNVSINTTSKPEKKLEPEKERFVTMYTFHGQGSPQTHQISSPLEFSQAADTAENLNTIIFLRGHQPPEMLNAIGARYRVDPEFFRQHLDITTRTTRYGVIPSTSLASSSKNILRLPSVTLASRSSSSEIIQPHHQGIVSRIRDETARLMDAHVDRYLQNREACLRSGTSIVRNLSVHNPQHFSLEQEISIYVAPYGREWISIIWLDAGSDLGQDQHGPWQAKTLQCESWEVQFHPIVQHRPGVALDSKHLLRRTTNFEVMNEKESSRLLQTAARLHRNYGENLDHETMTVDPFYALTEIFAFVASSEAQLLALLQLSLDRELTIELLSPYSLQTRSALWNLVYNKQFLDAHLRRLQDIGSFLDNRMKIVDWPCTSTPTTQKISSDAAEKLRLDYAHLIARARELSAAFDDGMNILQNNSMIAESQKAIQQAEGVAKLTGLAFFFIPLSLTASIFGMNVRQFTDGGSQSIWVWIVTSTVTLLFSYLALNWGNWRLTERMKHVRFKKRQKQKRSIPSPAQVFQEFGKGDVGV